MDALTLYSENETGCKSGRIQLMLTILLIFISGIQGGVLNYLLISYHHNAFKTYFWIIGDVLCMLVFCVTMYHAYTTLCKRSNHSYKLLPGCFRKFEGKTVVMPMAFVSWLLYCCVILSKILYFFLDNKDFKFQSEAEPQIIKITIAASSLVFLLLVEGHNNENRKSDRYSVITTVCYKVGLEILDSVSLLELMMSISVEEDRIFIGNSVTECVILVVFSVNFLFFTLSMYRLSLSDFGKHPFSKRLTKILEKYLIAVDVVHFAIRVWICIKLSQTISLFAVKNVLQILMNLLPAL